MIEFTVKAYHIDNQRLHEICPNLDVLTKFRGFLARFYDILWDLKIFLQWFAQNFLKLLNTGLALFFDFWIFVFQ